MNTIKTINDSNIEMLNESIVERHASMLISTLRENNFTLKTFFKNVSYIPKFEELDASCVTVHRRIDASLTKQIKNIIKEAHDNNNAIIIRYHLNGICVSSPITSKKK